MSQPNNNGQRSVSPTSEASLGWKLDSERLEHAIPFSKTADATINENPLSPLNQRMIFQDDDANNNNDDECIFGVGTLDSLSHMNDDAVKDDLLSVSSEVNFNCEFLKHDEMVSWIAEPHREELDDDERSSKRRRLESSNEDNNALGRHSPLIHRKRQSKPSESSLSLTNALMHNTSIRHSGRSCNKRDHDYQKLKSITTAEQHCVEKMLFQTDRLHKLMVRSSMTHSALQEWDRENGLPASHARTMVNTARSRKQLMDGVLLRKWNGTPLVMTTDMQRRPTY